MSDDLINQLYLFINQKTNGQFSDKEWLSDNFSTYIDKIITDYIDEFNNINENNILDHYNAGNKNGVLKFLNNIKNNHNYYDNGKLLVLASRNEDIETIKILLELGTMKKLSQALEWSAYRGNIDTIKLLVDYGADIYILKGTIASKNSKTIEYLKSINFNFN